MIVNGSNEFEAGISMVENIFRIFNAGGIANVPHRQSKSPEKLTRRRVPFRNSLTQG